MLLVLGSLEEVLNDTLPRPLPQKSKFAKKSQNLPRYNLRIAPRVRREKGGTKEKNGSFIHKCTMFHFSKPYGRFGTFSDSFRDGCDAILG